MSTLTRTQLVLALLLRKHYWLCPFGQVHPIDDEHSIITVHVFKSGLFSAFASNHEIRAPISGGFLDETRRSVELVIDSRKRVALDPGLAPGKTSGSATHAWDRGSGWVARCRPTLIMSPCGDIRNVPFWGRYDNRNVP